MKDAENLNRKKVKAEQEEMRAEHAEIIAINERTRADLAKKKS